MNASVRVPLRWLSKEALCEARYSQASDVFAFGVTLWEMYTYGQQPYCGYSNEQVIKMINDEVPLDFPDWCPPMIYGVMVECWHQHPQRRPTFAELQTRFQKWATSGQTQALMAHNPQRASSVHSGASSTNGGGGGGGRKPTRASLEQFGSGVPSPAPNSAAGTNNGGGGHLTKLAMLSNGSSIVHSTPKGKS